MTIQQAVKKYHLLTPNPNVAFQKAKDLNVEEVLYFIETNNQFVYLIKDGARGYYLYHDKRSLYNKRYKGLKMDKLED